MDYFIGAREGMKWDVSPFKAKEVPAFVATPSNKWSRVDNNDLFRSRLHSSPYLDAEKIKHLRLDIKGYYDDPPSPMCGTTMQKIICSSSNLSTKQTDDLDSGICLHQTQFYDTFSSASHSDSRAQFSLSRQGCTETKQTSTALIAPPNSSDHFGGKYAFDPLAKPFKPKGTNIVDINVPKQRRHVMAIDVAKSISTAYKNGLSARDGVHVLEDVTNSPQANDDHLVLSCSGEHTEIGSCTLSRLEKHTPADRRQQYRILGQGSGLLDGSDTFNHGRKEVLPDMPRTGTTCAISGAVLKPFPFAMHELKTIRLKKSEVVEERDCEDECSKGEYNANGPVATKELYAAEPLGIDIQRQELPGRQRSERDDSGKKVTFADIVRAGMKAINRKQAEQRLEMDVHETAPPGIFDGLFLPNNMQNKPGTHFPKFADGNDERVSYRPSKYRTEPCTTFHTIGVCPYGNRCNFYHEPIEKKEAPTVSKAMRYKTRLCKTWQKAGECPYGAKCDFAHGTNDLASNSPYRPHYKTRMCKVLQQTGRCPYGAQCTFAHKQGELRTDISLVYKYKTEICKSWALGLECSHGSDCHFAHGEKELNKDPCVDERF